MSKKVITGSLAALMLAQSSLSPLAAINEGVEVKNLEKDTTLESDKDMFVNTHNSILGDFKRGRKIKCVNS